MFTYACVCTFVCTCTRGPLFSSAIFVHQYNILIILYAVRKTSHCKIWQLDLKLNLGIFPKTGLDHRKQPIFLKYFLNIDAV